MAVVRQDTSIYSKSFWLITRNAWAIVSPLRERGSLSFLFRYEMYVVSLALDKSNWKKSWLNWNNFKKY